MEEVRARKPYSDPVLRKRRRLREIIEGTAPPVTDGTSALKGGCFGRKDD